MACNRIPVEVWDIILGHLDARTIKSLRLTNKRVSYCCSGPSFGKLFQHIEFELTDHGVQALHDLAVDSCWGSFVERLSLSADKDKSISTMQSYNSAEDRLLCYIKFSIPVDNELVRSQSDHRLEANDAMCPPWHVLAGDMHDEEQLKVNKWFFDSLVETFRALNKVKEISFWEDKSRGVSTPKGFRLARSFRETARLYCLTTAAILESNVVLDSFQLHFLSPIDYNLGSLLRVPFYSRGTPYSLVKVTGLWRREGDKFSFFDARHGCLPPSLFSRPSSPDPGEQIPPKLKPEAPNIRCLQLHVYGHPWGCEDTTTDICVFTKFIQYLEFACVEYVSLRNVIWREHDLLPFLKENCTIRHLELSKVQIYWGFWEPVLNFLATGMPALESLTLGHLQTSVPRPIPLVLVDEDPRDFPELTGDPNDASFSRTFSSAELARGLNFRGPVYYRGGRWEF